MPSSRALHRLQFATAIVATVGAVYGFSRLIKPHRGSCSSRRAAPAVTYVPASPIVPRVDPPLAPVVGTSPSKLRVTPAFSAAVAEGDLAAMKTLFVAGMPLDGMLAAAATTGNAEVVTWLLDHGADVHDSETDVEAPLLAADAHPKIVKLLLDRGASEPDLAVSAIAGAPNAVARALARHAPVNPKDGTTPLFDAIGGTLATPENRRLVIEKLLAAGADPNLGEPGSTPLGAALSGCEAAEGAGPPPCTALVRLLTGRGALVSGEVLQQAVALADDLRGPVLDALLAGRLAPDATAVALAHADGTRDALVVKKLVGRGVAWSFHDGEADTTAPLVEAVERLDVPLVRAMLDAGAPADLHLKDGRSPLGAAIDKVTEGDPSEAARVVELLIARGASANRRLPDGRTPLFAAAEAGEARVVTALLDHGARPNDVVLDETALDAAERSSHLAVARVLHAHGGARQKPRE